MPYNPRTGARNRSPLQPIHLDLTPHPPYDKPMDTRSVVQRLDTGVPVAAVDVCVELGAPGPLTRELLMRLALELVDSKTGMNPASLRTALQVHGQHLGASQAAQQHTQALLYLHEAGITLRSAVRHGYRCWHRRQHPTGEQA